MLCVDIGFVTTLTNPITLKLLFFLCLYILYNNTSSSLEVTLNFNIYLLKRQELCLDETQSNKLHLLCDICLSSFLDQLHF